VAGRGRREQAPSGGRGARSGDHERAGRGQTELSRHGFLCAGGRGHAQLIAGACPAGLGYTVADGHDGSVRLRWNCGRGLRCTRSPRGRDARPPTCNANRILVSLI
jgi:hypothetical protein